MDQEKTIQQGVLERRLRIQEALRDLGRSETWRALASVIADLQAEATRELYEVSADEIAKVARLQGECRSYDEILRRVMESESTLQEVHRQIETQNLKNEALAGLDREPPPGEEP